jgi:hypothetical protein
MKERERLITKIMTNVEFNAQISEAYEMGLNTAWEAAKRANEIDSDVYDELFPKSFIDGFYESYTAKEVIEKFAEYDAKHEHDDVIEVGDEVFISYLAGNGIVTYVDKNGRCQGVCGKGELSFNAHKDDLHKTGKHYSQIVEVLAEMRGEE